MTIQLCSRLLFALIAALWLGACGGSISGPQPTPEPRWIESAAPIELDNVEQLKRLGQLNQPNVVSTLFDHTVSPDATRLIALNNTEILAWDLLTGELVFSTDRIDATRAFYASDKTEIYAISGSGRVTIYDPATGAIRNTFVGHTNYGGLLAFDGEGDRLAIGGVDGTVKIWDLFERRALVTVNAHRAPITALALSADGALLATASGDQRVRVWDWATGTQRAELAIDESAVGRLAFAPQGGQLAIGTDRDVRLWSMVESAGPIILEAPAGGAFQHLRYGPDGQTLIGGGRAGGLTLWNPLAGIPLGQLPDVRGSQIDLDYAPDGTMLITTVLGGPVQLWNLTEISGQSIGRADLDVGTQQVLRIDWTNDGRLLLLFDASGPVYVWGIAS